jgi:hypothetical protein
MSQVERQVNLLSWLRLVGVSSRAPSAVDALCHNMAGSFLHHNLLKIIIKLNMDTTLSYYKSFFLSNPYFTPHVSGEPLTNRNISYIKVFSICVHHQGLLAGI